MSPVQRWQAGFVQLGPGASEHGGRVQAVVILTPMGAPTQPEEIRMFAVHIDRRDFDGRFLGRSGLSRCRCSGGYRGRRNRRWSCSRRVAQAGEPMTGDLQYLRQRLHLGPLGVGVPCLQSGNPTTAALFQSAGAGFLGQGRLRKGRLSVPTCLSQALGDSGFSGDGWGHNWYEK